MKRVIKNVMVVTPIVERSLIRNGFIEVTDNIITAIGPMAKMPKYKDDVQIYDGKSKIAIPGFIAGHNHLYSAVVRSIPYSGFAQEDFSFASWMERFWFQKLENKVNNDDVRAGTLINAIEHVKHGYTTTTDTVEGPNALPGTLFAAGEAVEKSGMRAELSFESTGRISDDNFYLGLQENIDFHKAMKAKGGRVQGRIGIHTTYTVTESQVKAARKAGDELGCGVMMHLSDARYHTTDSTLKYGKRPVKWLEDLGFLGPDVLFFHASYLDILKDPAILAKYGCSVSHQAVSNAMFGFWPNMIPLMLAGVTVALGTDGMTQSMFEIMRTSQMIHRLRYEELELLPDEEAFKMATINGAKAIGREKEIGSLEIGKKADIVLLENNSPVEVFEANIWNFLVSVADSAHVKTVFVDGQLVVEEGVHQLLDELEVRKECQLQAKDFWKRNGWETT
ncbi:MAG: amidohydrolase family protein [Sphaerochaetaceae bacterium]